MMAATPRDLNESWRITRIGPKGGQKGVQDPQLRWKRGKIRCDAGNNDMRREEYITTFSQIEFITPLKSYKIHFNKAILNEIGIWVYEV